MSRMSIPVNSNFTAVFFKAAGHVNPGAENKFKHIFLKFSKTSVKSNLSLLIYKSWHLPRFFILNSKFSYVNSFWVYFFSFLFLFLRQCCFIKLLPITTDSFSYQQNTFIDIIIRKVNYVFESLFKSFIIFVWICWLQDRHFYLIELSLTHSYWRK